MENYKTVTTGPHPGSSGACQAKFNHKTYSHFHTQKPQPTYPNPQYNNGYFYTAMPTGKPPFGYYPYQYY